ncbi:MAG TPA: RidA family protein [Streptosporangiaceae bacterium]|jgi:enamine deaminase RidA (YjgF/YER057c/UK114 family)
MPVTGRLTTAPGVAAGPGFAHAVSVAGSLAFVSGQVALDAEGALVGPGDVAAQTRQALANLHAIIRALGADWPDVARFGWYVLDASAVQIIRDVRDEMIRPALGDHPNPASSLVQVAALVRPEFLIEVDAVVALPGG